MIREILQNMASSRVARCEESATAVPLPDMETPPPAPTNEAVPTLVQQALAIEKEKERIPNPGLYEHAQGEFKSTLTPDVFDGMRFEMHNNVGPKFATSHTLWLGSAMIPGGFYQFGANVVMGDNPADPKHILISRISPDARLDARYHLRVNEPITMRAQAQVASEEGQSNALVDFDYKGETCTVNAKLSQGPLFGLSYFQSITKNLAVGGEGYYHDEHKKTVMSYAARYNSDKFAVMGVYGSMGTLQLQYLQKLDERVRLASEFALSPTGESAANFGGAFQFRKSRVLINCDSSYKIGTSIETQVLPGMNLLLSAESQPLASDFKFGYGLQLGQ